MQSAIIHLACLGLLSTALHGQDLTNSTDIEPTFSWWQQPGGWTYPVDVRVPEGPPPPGGFPVCVLLHGNGGNGFDMLQGFGNLITCHALIAPTGYANSWNICAEQSDAPDTAMIDELVTTLQTFDNVNASAIRLLGFSNGSALCNRVLIENDAPGIDMIAAVVSQLSESQYHENSYHYPLSGGTEGTQPYCGYDTPKSMSHGRRYLSICNQNDPIIPYNGGPSGVGVTFLNAQFAAWLVAQSQGHDGGPVPGAGEQIGNSGVFAYTYLDGDVVHLRGNSGHGINPTQEAYIVDFLGDCDVIIDCDGDITGNGTVNVDDLLAVISNWSTPYGVDDLLAVIAGWGPCE